MSSAHHHGLGFFDPLTGIDSPLHRAPASAKLLTALAIIATLALTPLTPTTATTVFPTGGLFLVIACGIGFVPPMLVVKRILLLEPVVLAAAAFSLLQPNGLSVFVGVAFRSTLCIATIVILSCTTPFPEIIAVLRRWRLPPLMITTLALMFRYLFLLAEESQSLRRARASRTFARRRWLVGHFSEWLTLGTSAGTLFVRTADRADRVHSAMISRGWK